MKLKIFTVIFACIVILELYFGSTTSLEAFRYFSKPSIVIAPIIYFFLNAKTIAQTIKIPILLAFSSGSEIARCISAFDKQQLITRHFCCKKEQY